MTLSYKNRAPALQYRKAGVSVCSFFENPEYDSGAKSQAVKKMFL